MQWLPTDAAAASAFLLYLVKRGLPFSVRYSTPDTPLHHGDPIVVLQRDRQHEESIWPGDWLVREGPGVYAAWTNDYFANEHDAVESDD